MNERKNKDLTVVLDGLMRRYRERVPDVDYITKCMVKDGLIKEFNEIENDHIAFRTLGVPHLGIASLEKIFIHLGYSRRDPYRFEKKKLDAYWYSPPNNYFPRIFISELRVKELSQKAQEIIYSYTNEVKEDPVNQLDLDNPQKIDEFLHSPLWRLCSLKDYQFLLKESEFASWAIYNRYYLNHFTISVHNLPKNYNTIMQFNKYLESKGIKLNDSGGKIKTSLDNLLIQSSTVSKLIEGIFDNGNGEQIKQEVSGSYVEFAERKVLPNFSNLEPSQIKREHRREGFDAGNANNIFESTYTDQIKKSR